MDALQYVEFYNTLHKLQAVFPVDMAQPSPEWDGTTVSDSEKDESKV